MIYSLTGTISQIEPYLVVIECGGVGYGVKTSMTTLGHLPGAGEKAQLFTHLYLREDAMELYGFATLQELGSFKMLISISGVGPKAAISVLSDLSPEQFALCVASGDAKTLTRAQGIGLKTAQRIVLELKDKIAGAGASAGIRDTVLEISNKTGNASEAITALEVLGYSRSEATQVVSALDSAMPVEDMIKQGLKVFGGKR